MLDIEIWLDIHCRIDGEPTTVCTLFAAHKVGMRPLSGESVTYHPGKGRAEEFQVCTSGGPMRVHMVTVEVEEVRHYAVRTDDGHLYKTAVRYWAVEVPSLNDARALCALMTEEHGFELDSFGPNRLAEQA